MASHAADRFRANVRHVMDERGLTITELAERISTSRPGMSRILSGDDGVTLDRAERIAKALKIPLSELISENLKILASAS